MKTLVLLGGMTPDVTSLYYNIINNHIRRRLGASRSARIYIYSVDLESQLQRVKDNDWSAFANEYIDAMRPLVQPSVASSSSMGVLLGAIIAHKVSKQISSQLPVHIPFLDVTDFLAVEIKAKGISRVGLIGPKPTMIDDSPDFFRGKLTSTHGVEVIIPETQAELDEVNRGMFEEVVKGKDAVTSQTKQMFMDAANKLIERGAQGLILGSTDLGFVLDQQDFEERGVSVFDAAKIHAVGVAEWALQDDD